jgi:hypothetical protein
MAYMTVEERAKIMLKKLVEVERWVKSGDPRATPYLNAGAVCFIDGKVQFHRDRFLYIYSAEQVQL